LDGLQEDEALDFWRGMARNRVLLLGARDEQGRIIGTVQLRLASYPNGRHRAEVAKLLVHSSWRRRGIATELMRAAEREAAAAGVWLLYLDTETGSGAEPFYRGLGWTEAGVIPDFAYGPDGRLSPSTFFYKRLARTRSSPLRTSS
jgi:GNAT superfamily N-acetyltransferase